MATRVNKKLLVIVFSCAAIAIGVVALVMFKQWRGDPMRHIRAGDAFMAQNDFRRAAGEYGRAVGKRSGEVAFYTKYLDAMSKVVPATTSEALENYQTWIAFFLKRAQIARTDESLWRPVISERLFQSEMNDSNDAWQSLFNFAQEDLLKTVEGDEKLTLAAQALMGYAHSREPSALTPDELAKSIELMEATVKAAKGEYQDLAYGGLLSLRLNQAVVLTRSGQPRLAAEAWKTFDQLLARAEAEQPTGFQIVKHRLQRLSSGATFNVPFGDAPIAKEQIAAAAEKLVARAKEDGTAVGVLDATKSLGSVGVPDGMRLAADLTRWYVKDHPDALFHRRVLATVLQAFDPEAAKAEAIALIDHPQMPVSLIGAIQNEIRVMSARQLFDVEYSKASLIEKGPELDKQLEGVDAALARIRNLATGMSDDSIVLTAEGKRALAAGDVNTAYAKLSDVLRKGTMVDAELYFLLSILAERRGETGLAQEYVTRGLEGAPGNGQLLLRAGALALGNGRFAQAIAILTPLVAREPDNADAKRMLEAAKSGNTPSAIDPNDPVVKEIARADDLRVNGKFDEAAAIMRALIEKNPDNLQVIVATAICELDAKNPDAARALVERGYKIQPNHPILRSVEMGLAGDDPVARVIASVSREHPEEPDRTVWMAVRIAQLRSSAQRDIDRLDREGGDASVFKNALPGIERAEAEWKAKADAVGATHPAWLDYRMTSALMAKDFAGAEAIAADVERSGKNPLLAPMFRARIALVKGNNGEAVTILQRAIDSNLDDAETYKLLGSAHERVGDLASALKAYAEAYRRKPTDLPAAKFYVSTLVKAGDRSGALTVLRDVRKIAGEDPEVGETWLDLEREIGDRSLARQLRAARYSLVPGDRTNSLKYATMLAELEPDRPDVLDNTGNAKFTDSAWRALDERTRQQEIQRVRADWRVISDRIFTELLAKAPTDIEVAMLRASTARRQAREQVGEAALRDVIKNAGEKVDYRMYVALGVHMNETGDLAKCAEAFQKAVSLQDPKDPQANIAIAEYYFQRSDWQQALEHLLEVAKVRGTERLFQLRLAEVYGRIGKYDEAKAQLDKAVANGGRDVTVDQLEANMAESRCIELARAGKQDEALKVIDEGLAAVKRAAAAAPANPVISVQEATLHRRRYDITGDQAALDAGIAAADRAGRQAATYWAAAQAKSDLLLAKGKPAEAIVELERFVKAAPSNADGRARLIEILYRSGNGSRAVDVAKEAIAISPNDPQWRVALAEVYVSMNQVDQAIVAYEQADRIRPSVELLSRLTDLRMRLPKPDWSQVLATLREREADVRSSPYLQSCIGVSLANNGDQANGLEVLRSAYKASYAAIAAGQANPSIIDSWFKNLTYVFPAGRTAEAEKFAMSVAGDKPTMRDRRWIVELWYAAGPAGASQVIDLGQKAIAADDHADNETTARLYDMVGGVKFGMGDCAGARALYADAAKALPDEPAILNNLAYITAECGDPKEAVEIALKTNRLAPGNAEYLDTLGYAQMKAGLNEDAAESFRQSIQARPSASALLHYAQVLHALGKDEEARTQLRAAGDQKPDEATQKQINALIEKLR